MKTVYVVAAIIRHGDRIFATQRGYGPWKGWWEFPGGKVEPNETPENALEREIREELETEIRIERFLRTIEYDYPDFHLSMRCYLCSIASGDLTLKEHEASAWLTRDNLKSLRWLPADITILEDIEELL